MSSKAQKLKPNGIKKKSKYCRAQYNNLTKKTISSGSNYSSKAKSSNTSIALTKAMCWDLQLQSRSSKQNLKRKEIKSWTLKNKLSTKKKLWSAQLTKSRNLSNFSKAVNLANSFWLRKSSKWKKKTRSCWRRFKPIKSRSITTHIFKTTAKSYRRI